jgi:hypothetical protein
MVRSSRRSVRKGKRKTITISTLCTAVRPNAVGLISLSALSFDSLQDIAGELNNKVDATNLSSMNPLNCP